MTNRAPLIVAIVLLLLPVLYVGSYLALVAPEGVPLILDGKNFGGHGGSYRYNPDLLSEKAFYPLEQIDRKVRPGAWLIYDSSKVE
ncbi:hypothetical protein NA78x_002055 [Anatilimnocola sp. NA78]|uniref:hypothetical protein n=1 Tax=Anatilimnocola sp. NA78 TaxID=3415683 RepID=UPI003CE4708B